MTQADLTPRDRPPRKRRSVGPMLLIAVVVVAIGALLFKTLGDASLFFKNVDEAVSQRDSLGQKRFRMQGTVVAGTIMHDEIDGRGAVLFTVAYKGAQADVASFDTPTELFKDGIPVVLEGKWQQGAGPAGAFDNGAHDGWYFASDRILVKHDASYESKNKARLQEAELGGKTPVNTASGSTAPVNTASGSTASGSTASSGAAK